MLYYEDLELNQPNYSDTYIMEKEEIMSFAKQWDPQPFHIDEEAAKQWPLGLTASSVHTIAASVKLINRLEGPVTAAVAGLGWNNVKMPKPVKPGDALRAKAWVSSKRESNSRPDCGIFTNQVEVYNQDDEIVLSYDIATLVLKRPTA